MSGGGSSSQILGYKYFMDLHMGISRGPIDMLKEIEVGGKKAWPIAYTYQTGGGVVNEYDAVGGIVSSSYVTETYATDPAPAPIAVSTAGVLIRAPELFGGEKKEGGIEGELDVMMGEITQGVNSRLSAMLGGSLVSAFRGVVTLFYTGLIASMNPYPKVWRFRVCRALAGWDGAVFHSTAAVIPLTATYPDVAGGPPVVHDIYAMNPAHIIYECYTNRDWGRGFPSSVLDAASFTAVANTLVSEGFGLCLKWSRADTVDAFVQIVLDHIGGAIYPARGTGLLTLKLIRGDYSIGPLPQFTTENGILSIEDDDSAMSQGMVNEIIVKYVNPIDGKDGQIRVQNLGSMQSVGAVNSKTVEYPGLPTGSLAARIGQRDLRVHSTNLRRLKLTMNRKGYDLVPGGVMRISNPARGIGDMVLRIGKITDQTDSTLVIQAVQDVFSLSATSYVTPQTFTGTADRAPVPALFTEVRESTYADLVAALSPADLAALTGDETYAYVVAAKPASFAIDFKIWSGTSVIGYADKGAGVWTPMGTLSASIDLTTTSRILTNVTLPANIAVGTLALIDEEIVQVIGYNTGTRQLDFVRGCIDTIPATHALNAKVWFYSLSAGADRSRYSESEVVGAKALTRTPDGELPETATTYVTRTMAGRSGRPYPPGLVAVDGIPYATATEMILGRLLTWVHRNKVLQADVIMNQQTPNVTPDVGLTYTVRVRRQSDNGIQFTYAGITGNSWSYPEADFNSGGRVTAVILELVAVHTLKESFQPYLIPITIRDDGWGFDFGNDFGNNV